MRRIAWLVVVLCGGALLASPPESHAAEPTEKQFSNSLAMKFVRIEPGAFLMGQGEAPPRTSEDWITRDGDESPAHTVHVREFHIGSTEVTNAQYELCDPEHKKLRGLGGVSKADDAPVTSLLLCASRTRPGSCRGAWTRRTASTGRCSSSTASKPGCRRTRN